MTNRTNADFLQVLLREAREGPFVYFVLAKCGLVLFEAKAPQPSSEVHDNAQAPPCSISSLERPGERWWPRPLAPFSGDPSLAGDAGGRNRLDLLAPIGQTCEAPGAKRWLGRSSQRWRR